MNTDARVKADRRRIDVRVVSAERPGSPVAVGWKVHDRKLRVSIARVDDHLYAFDDLCPCTDEQCPLSGGLLTGTTIMCQCHGSRFDIATGAVIVGPAKGPLTVYDVREVDGEIRIREPPCDGAMAGKPTNAQIATGAHAVAYRAEQLVVCFTVLFRTGFAAPAWTRQSIRNAVVESVLSNSRGLAYFFTRPADVHTAMFIGEWNDPVVAMEEQSRSPSRAISATRRRERRKANPIPVPGRCLAGS